MACNSFQNSSSALVTRNYDVFVSFRGKDTRNNFTDHLFGALRRKGILTFRDDKKLRKGESIEPELLLAIEGSQVYVVVFSENYASSTWCLRELEKILACVKISGKRVLPIFCDVDPSTVRYQKRSYAAAFAKHEERFKQDLEMVQRWRTGLTQVVNLSGWDLHDKPQYAEIQKIVEEIINILGYKFSSLPNDLVGMHSPIEELEKLLLLDAVDDVRVVGICGMGGLGKTTLATVLYGRISHQFDACCFIDDLRKIYTHNGPSGVQKQILHQILGEEHLQICNLYNATNLMRSRLHRIRTLIILDNVDQAEQLEKLAMNSECLGVGSRIIIVSRDEHILREYGVNVVYKVPLLDDAKSLKLFCRKSLKRDNIISDYERLAYDILGYANGLPLAIKVMGSFLFGRDISEWKSALARLKESPNKDIMDVLRLSFDGLEEMEKEIFLDIACFFVDKEEKYVKHILKCCGFHPDIGLRVLIDKSLISINYNWSSITIAGLLENIKMHGLLRELGQKIVQENSRNWIRLWRHENFYKVMLENKEKNVEAIVLDHTLQVGERKILMGETLSKMSHLRLLILKEVGFSGSLSCLSNELRYLEWYDYPFMYLPSSFDPEHLVELHLWCSNIKQLWKGKKCLPNLTTLDLTCSTHLIEMPNFEEVPNLERLNLEACTTLVQMDPSICVLRKLVFLNLKNCYSLRSIPDSIFGLNSLEYLNLSGCFKLFNDLDSAIASCWLPSLPSFSCLCELNLSSCDLRKIPDVIGCMHWLEKLDLGGNKFVTLPSLKKLSKLVYLNLQYCKRLKYLPELPSPMLPSPITIEREQPMFPRNINYGRRSPGLYIFDCPNLGEWERCSRMTFSWMIEFIQANQESPVPFRCINIIIPGSEIPKWFSNQSMGSSISMDPSPIMHDNNSIGVVVCVVFSVAAEYYCLEHETIELNLNWIQFDNGMVFLADCITVKSNNMWLIYFPHELFLNELRCIGKTLRDVDDIKMKASIETSPDLHVEVMNCGYCWVFKQDLQIMHHGNSLAWRHEFLAIEDQAQSQLEPFI